jgi:outer membrane murein-binding lipoprotein Lpp
VDAHRRAAVSSGNPRITVAFPFSRIDIKEPSEAVRELAALVEQLAEQAVTFARQAAPDHADEADRLAAQATLLAHRLAV